MNLNFPKFAALALTAGAALSAHALDFLPSYAGIDALGAIAGNSTMHAPGFGTGSWQQSGNAKAQVYFDATAIFGRNVTVGELQSISYFTNKSGGYGAPDWTLAIYTKTGTGSDSAGWYGSRLNAEPYYTNTLSAAGNQWNQWSTAAGQTALRFYDAPRTGHFGAYDDPTLAALTAGSVTFDPTTASPVSRNYSTESVRFFTLGTGSVWSTGFDGKVDGLTVTLSDNTSRSFNLEAVAAVPEPGTYALLMAGLGVVVTVSRRARRV